MAIARKGVHKKITKNFTQHELRSRSLERGFSDGIEDFNLDDDIIECLQIIRDYYGIPITVSSTGRSPKHNASLKGSATNSQHLYKNGTAIDFSFVGMKTKGTKGYEAAIHYTHQMANKGELYDLCFEKGLRGVGYYNSFFHIDARKQSHLSTWGIGARDMRLGKTFNLDILTTLFNKDDEDGIIDAGHNPIVKWGILTLGGIIIGKIIHSGMSDHKKR